MKVSKLNRFMKKVVLWKVTKAAEKVSGLQAVILLKKEEAIKSILSHDFLY